MKTPKRDLNAFNISFLDLLSGALGAVIILFVLIPKINPVEHENLKKQNTQLAYTVSELNETEKQLQKQIQSKLKQSENLELSNEELQRKVTELQSQVAAKDSIMKMYQARLGFALQDKEVIFVVDASKSMDDEDRFIQVLAGIKMLVASMDDTYKVDVVIFQAKGSDSFKGSLVSVTKDAKYQIYQYLSAQIPGGGTPTGKAMDYVLTNPSYADAGVVYVLSDGDPDGDNNVALQQITAQNNGQKTINTIGVGDDFRDQTVSNSAKTFMIQLAEFNGGFYVGF